MQSVSSRIWTRVAVSISYDDNHYTSGTPGMLIMASEKWQVPETMELPNLEKIRTLGEKDVYKYLGTLEVDTTKKVEIKENN